jgi:hypothetical protein
MNRARIPHPPRTRDPAPVLPHQSRRIPTKITERVRDPGQRRQCSRRELDQSVARCKTLARRSRAVPPDGPGWRPGGVVHVGAEREPVAGAGQANPSAGGLADHAVLQHVRQAGIIRLCRRASLSVKAPRALRALWTPPWVEPPTFRSSGECPGPHESTTACLSRLDDLFRQLGVQSRLHASTTVVSTALAAGLCIRRPDLPLLRREVPVPPTLCPRTNSPDQPKPAAPAAGSPITRT